jgi:hypothetical protein
MFAKMGRARFIFGHFIRKVIESPCLSLGDLSGRIFPYWAIFSVGRFSKMTEVAQSLGLFFLRDKLLTYICVNFRQNTGLARF